MSACPAPEIPNLTEREGLVVAVVVVVVLHSHVPIVGCRSALVRSLVQWPALARTSPQEEQGVVVLFPTNSNAIDSAELSLRRVWIRPTVPLQSSQPHRQPSLSRFTPGHGRHQGGEGFSLDVPHPA